MMLTKDSLTILTSAKKAAAFEKDCREVFGDNVPGGKLDLTVLVKDKTDSYASNYAALMAEAKKGSSDNKVNIGTFTKSKQEGNFTTGWNNFVASDADASVVDVSAGFAEASAVKDEKELLSGKNAARLSAKVVNLVKGEIIKAIDEGKPPTHQKLSEKMEGILDNPIAALKLSGVSEEDFESCYPPTIQSGGEYNLSLGYESNNKTLSGDIIIASLGGRFEYYCAHLTRTYFINPTSHVQKVYQLLVDVEQLMLKSLKDGTPLKDVYKSAEDYIKEDSPNMLQYFTKNVGFGIGIGLRDSSYVLSSKNGRTLKENMTYAIHIGFENVPMELTNDEKKKKAVGARALKTFSCALGDTVVVGLAHQNAEILTNRAKSEWGKVSFDITDSDEEEEEEEVEEAKSSSSSSSSSRSDGTRRSSRIDHEAMDAQRAKLEELERKQLAVLKKRQEKALRDARDRAARAVGTDNDGGKLRKLLFIIYTTNLN
jgi:nucleosome binding factor SPN SPT16 subunit